MARIRFKRYSEIPQEAWDQFLKLQERANVYHTIAWANLIETIFSNEPCAWLLERDGQIAAALPAVLVKYPLLGTKLISLPYQAHSGGPLGGDSEDKRKLLEEAVAASKQYGARYVELRSASPIEEAMDFQLTQPFFCTETALRPPDILWNKFFYNHRWGVHKSRNEGVEVVLGKDKSHWRAFHAIYLDQQRAQALVPYSWKFMSHMAERANKYATLFLARRRGEWIGGALLLCFHKTALYKLGACRLDQLRYQPYNALVWRALSWAAQAGYAYFHHGMTPAHRPGLIRFKEGWDATTRPVLSYSFGLTGKAPDLSKYFTGYSLARTVWKFLPLVCTDWAAQKVKKWVC